MRQRRIKMLMTLSMRPDRDLQTANAANTVNAAITANAANAAITVKRERKWKRKNLQCMKKLQLNLKKSRSVNLGMMQSKQLARTQWKTNKSTTKTKKRKKIRRLKIMRHEDELDC